MNIDTEVSSEIKSLTKLQINKINVVEAIITKVTNLNTLEYERLYHIYTKYYEGHSKDQFLKDLFEKNHIILLRDKKNKSLQGFSTLLKVKIPTANGFIYGVYSGDTILEKEYWGHPALGKAFLRYLWIEKLKNPFSPLYWFLISKGYKTYLIMANNFKTHFPRYETETPDYARDLMNNFYGVKFQDAFVKEKLWIRPNKYSCRLKDQIADISDKDRNHPRIAYFERANPNWKMGCELACIAKMTLLMPMKYTIKKILMTFFKPTLKRSSNLN